MLQVFSEEVYPEIPSNWVKHEGLRGSEIPKTPGVYIVSDGNGVIAYVGQTKNLSRRIIEHHVWMDALGTCAVSWVELPIDGLLFCEAWFIAKLRPYLTGLAVKQMVVRGSVLPKLNEQEKS